MQLVRKIAVILSLAAIFIAILGISFEQTAKSSQPTTFHDADQQIELANPSDYQNCVVVRKEKTVLYVNKVETSLDNSTLVKDLSSKLALVNDLNIIYSRDAEYACVIKVLKAVTASKMENYRLLKM